MKGIFIFIVVILAIEYAHGQISFPGKTWKAFQHPTEAG